MNKETRNGKSADTVKVDTRDQSLHCKKWMSDFFRKAPELEGCPTISLIDDDPDFCELIAASMRMTGKLRLVGSYASGEEALKNLPRRTPDVALVDIKLPGMNGISCVRQFRLMTPALPTRFLILTDHDDDELVFSAFRAGARGYLLKDHTWSEGLYDAIQDTLNGGAPMTPRIASKVVGFFEEHAHLETCISEREGEVLQRLAGGLAYKEIAGDLSISLNTVRKHVGAIYQKLHVHSRTAAAMQFVREHGVHPNMEYRTSPKDVVPRHPEM